MSNKDGNLEIRTQYYYIPTYLDQQKNKSTCLAKYLSEWRGFEFLQITVNKIDLKASS